MRYQEIITETVGPVDRDQALIDFLKRGATPNFDPAANWHLFCHWAVHYGGGSGEVVQELGRFVGDDLSAEDFETEIDNLMGLDPALYHRFPADLRSAFETEMADEITADQKVSSTQKVFRLLSDTKLPPDTLLVHFTDHPDEILRHGFRRGVRDLNHLGETVRLPDWMKVNPGYNFAYLTTQTGFGLQNGAWKRSHAVLFRHTGVHVMHYGDREEQVIFWGPNVPIAAILRAVPAEEFHEVL